MKRKEAIEYLSELCDELANAADELEINEELATGLMIGIIYAKLVLEGEAGKLSPKDEADVIATFAMLLGVL